MKKRAITKKRFAREAEPYKLYCKHNENVTNVGDGLPDVPKKSFCYNPIKNYLIKSVRAFLKFITVSSKVEVSNFESSFFAFSKSLFSISKYMSDKIFIA